jgi:quercetin dioxygenase-like cupin family protein
MKWAFVPVLLAAGVGQAQSAGTQVREVMQRTLPPFQGKQVYESLVEVTYGPGSSSKPHSHGCAVTVYVVSGAVRSQVRGEAEKVYKAGDTFFEAPNGVHQISANASQTEPAKFVAYFVCDGSQQLSKPAETGGSQ